MSRQSVSRVVIATGGTWTKNDYTLIQNNDIVIGVDGGVIHLCDHGILPHMAVGDFDTASPEIVKLIESKGVRIERLPRDKDVTDTHYAIQKALQYEPNTIVLLGAWGSRWDHTLANVHLMERILEEGVQPILENWWNRMQLVPPGKLHIERSRFYYMSLLPWTEEVHGLSLTGFRYPLENATIRRMDSLTISNEWVEATGTIQHREGLLLVIQSRDAS